VENGPAWEDRVTDTPPTPNEVLRLWSTATRTSADERWHVAVPAWRAITQASPFDGHAWDMLGLALYATEEFADASAAFERAFALGTGPGVCDWRFPSQIAYSITQCMGKLVRVDDAKSWFQKALDLGLRDTAAAADDDALAAVRDMPEFALLLTKADTSAMSRADGIRLDLDVTRHEVKRRARLPFPRLDETAFDARLDALTAQAGDLDDDQLLVELSRLLALVNDGHSGVALADSSSMPRLPVEFFLFDRPEPPAAEPPGIVIISASEPFRRMLGSRVRAIDDRPVSEILQLLDPLINRDNEWQVRQEFARCARMLTYLHGLGIARSTEGAALTLELPDGTTTTVDLPAERFETSRVPPPGWVRWVDTVGDPPLCFRNVGEPFWFIHLPEPRVLYVQFNAVRDDPAESLEHFTSRLAAAIDRESPSKLVVDVRWNGGGNTFLTLPLLHMIIASPMNHRGALFVITGRGTYSAAQNFSTMLWRHTNAIFVGEPTGASPNFIGETVFFPLPYSKLEVNVSDLYWGTSWPLDSRTSLVPLIYAPPAYAAWSAGRDPALEAILLLDEALPSP
jgi:hypothetical protein